jgi:hypothetical protein
MFCHQCGAGIDGPDDRFCSRCGAPLHRGDGTEGAGPQSPLAEPPADRHRRPISAWPDRPRERIQLPLTELRQRRVRETAEPAPLPPAGTPAPPVSEPPAAEAPPPADAFLETVEPAGAPEEPLSTSRSRAEAALLRMVPPRDEWAEENRPGPAERGRVRDEWPAPAPRAKAEPPAAPPAPVAAAPPAEEPPADDPIIPWLEPPVVPAGPERPAPPSREAKPEEGPIIVPRDYDENAARQRKGRRGAARARGPLIDPASLGRSIKPSWILAIAGVILLTLIVFALFPPGGGSEDAAGTGKVNPFTGMPVHTVATPVRPTAGTPAVPPDTAVATSTPEPTATRLSPVFGVLPGATTRPTTAVPATTAAGAAEGATGIRVVVSSAGGWSGTIGQQAETYTETPVVGSGTQVRGITGPATMVTANIQKLDQSTDLLEVRVERDGVLLKRGQTTDPAGIVALSVQV